MIEFRKVAWWRRPLTFLRQLLCFHDWRSFVFLEPGGRRIKFVSCPKCGAIHAPQE